MKDFSVQLAPIERLEIFVLMDNVSDPFSHSHPQMRWNESQYRANILKKHETCGADFCRACNGLSLLMRFYRGTDCHTILFDAGPDENLVVDNAKRLQVDLTNVEALILSHGHFDHYGGTLSVLDAIGQQGLPVYSHPELFTPRAFDKGTLSPCSYNLSNDMVEKHGGIIHETRDPTLLFDDTLLISGEVPRETSYELGSPAECRKVAGQWVNSPEVVDERILIFNLKDKGLCVFTACGHTGVINAVNYAKKLTKNSDIHLIMGGLHLAPPEVHERVAPTMNDLIALQPDLIITGHCTGANTQATLTSIFSDQHIAYSVGSVFNFQTST